MKKFFVVYLCVLCLAPILANASLCSSTDDPTACVGCVQNGGKYWNDIDSPHCLECSADTYHTTCTNANDCEVDCSPVNTSGHSGYFRSNDGTTRHSCPEPTLYSSSNAQNYNNEVQTYIYQCEAHCGTANMGWHIIHANDSAHTYFCGTCGAGTQNGTSAPYTCDCYQYAEAVNGTSNALDNFSNSSLGHPVQCRCKYGSQYTNNSCECITGFNDNGNSGTCCPGRSTYDSNAGDCVCNVQFAKITRDANNKLTECACNDGTITIHSGNSCGCQSGQYVTFDNNTNPKVNWGETSQYLSSCTTCPQNSSPDTQTTYPRFCKCNATYYQEAPSSTSNITPTCHKCPTQTQTPLPGSVGPESCRLKEETNFSISNTHTRSMRLIPQGATILPIYTDPYVQNNNNAQSQYSY